MPTFLGQDENTIQMQGDDGTPITIAKSALTPEQQAIYSGLGAVPKTDYASMGQLPASTSAPVMPQAPVAPAPVAMPSVESGTKLSQPASPIMKPGDIATPTTPDSALPTGSLDKGLALESRGIAKEAQAGIAEGARQAGIYTGLQNTLEQNQKEKQAAEAEKQKFVSSSMDDYKKSADEIASNKVQDFWADKSTGARIAAAIAVGLGAIAASRSGGPNHAAGIVNDAINRDLQRQQLEMNNKKEGLAAKKGLFEMNLQKYGSREAALAATGAQLTQIAQIQLNKSASLYKGAEAGANADKLNGALDLKKAEYEGKLAEAKAKQWESQKENLVAGLTAEPQFASTKDQATDFNKFLAENNKAKSGINDLLGFADMPGSSISPEIRAKAQVTAALVRGALRTSVLGPGTVNDQERKILEGIAVDPTKIFSLDTNNKARLKTVLETLDKNLAIEAKAHGLVPPKQIGTVRE